MEREPNAGSKAVELVARTPIKYGGKRYAEGDKFTASEHDAEPLIDSGSADLAESVVAKADAEAQPAHAGKAHTPRTDRPGRG